MKGGWNCHTGSYIKSYEVIISGWSFFLLLMMTIKKLSSKVQYLLSRPWQQDTTLVVFLTKPELKAFSKMRWQLMSTGVVVSMPRSGTECHLFN